MRIVARWGAALLVASFLAVVGGSAHATDYPLTERWCGPGVAKPCIVSFKRGTTPEPEGFGDLVVEATTQMPQDWGHEFTFSIDPDPSSPSPIPLTTSDVLTVVFDTGARHPDKIEGFENQADVDVWQDSTSGDWMLRIIGSPVREAIGCDSNAAWPWPCPHTATDSPITFEGDVTTYSADTNQDFVGFYAGTNVTYNGIFFETDSSGHQFLETEAVAPHEYTDHTTVVGAIHFRVPYVMLRQDFGIPNPETMTPGSLAGTVNSVTASFDIAQDPDGGGIYVDVSGFTFTKRTIKVMAGRITPTRPVITRAKRVSGRRIWLTHTLSKPRGAKVTGYVAQCVNGSSVRTGTAAATATGIGVGGLRAAKAYDCRVAATSKVGRGAWSTWVHVRRA